MSYASVKEVPVQELGIGQHVVVGGRTATVNQVRGAKVLRFGVVASAEVKRTYDRFFVSSNASNKKAVSVR